MKTAPLVVSAAAIAAMIAIVACGQPRMPEPASDADAGELTCDEKARADLLCKNALRQRCDSQSNDCEVSCESRGDLPANTQKVPSERGDIESTQCRENCRHGHDACVLTIAQRCPVPCQ